MNDSENPVLDDASERLLDLAREHFRLFGDEEIELEDWGIDASNPVELAARLEELEETISLAKNVKSELEAALQDALDGSAVRIGHVVYVEGSSSGTWKPTAELWKWLVSNLEGEKLAGALSAIVSGIRVTAIDRYAVDVLGDDDADDEETKQRTKTVRDTFLNYREGRWKIQRKDLSVKQVSDSARKWWPTEDGAIAEPPTRGDAE